MSVKLIGNGPKNTSKFSAGPGDFSSDFLGFPPAGFVAVGAWKASNSWALKDVLVSYDRNSSMGKSHGLQGGRLRIDPLFIYLFYIFSNWDMLICYSLSKSTSTTREIHHLPWFFFACNFFRSWLAKDVSSCSTIWQGRLPMEFARVTILPTQTVHVTIKKKFLKTSIDLHSFDPRKISRKCAI